MDDLLICPVCLDSYKDPKTLGCLHSFCCKCLESCRRPYRRDITCPICKKVTALSPMGVQGLQNDFRIQQIRDILINRPNSPGTSSEDVSVVNTPNFEAKTCDLCKSQMKVTTANSHCIQCYMYFCESCSSMHNSNPLFASHHMINMKERQATDTLFCKNHRDHPVRYFCKPCSLMMCTICTMSHSPEHAPEPLEKGIIDKYRQELHESLKTVKSKLSEVKSRSKYLEAMKQSQQRALFCAQQAIREKAEELVSCIREQEERLLMEAHEKIDSKMKENGVPKLGEISFHQSSMESLYADIQRVIQGSPQDCLISYDDLISRMRGISDTSLPSIQKRKKSRSTVKFVPATSDIHNIIGKLQEFSLSETESSEEEEYSASPPSGGFISPKSKSQVVPRRTSSIINAIASSRKSEVKIGKVKAYSQSPPPLTECPPTSPSSSSTATVTVDDIIDITGGGAGSPGNAGDASPSSPAGSPPCPSSPCQDSESRAAVACQPRLLYKVDQVGGWPGRISSPSSLAFVQDGAIVIAECENRLQIFDKTGHSVRIIAWGKVKPQCVAVSAEGKIYITDKKDRCVKIFELSGEMISTWTAGQFSSPAGIAVSSSGHVVVTDLDCNNITLFNPDGTVVKKFGSWGSADYQFNHPTHITVDRQDNIIVSDSGNSCIKIYDKEGNFKNKFTLQSSKQGFLRRPQGVVAVSHGNLLICDRDNHRLSLFSNDGKFLRHVMTKQDALRYPCDVALDSDNQLVAVVESHSGFLSKDPHHAIKLFHLQGDVL